MLEKVNGGDREALRSFLQTYAKYILNRATRKAPDEATAREATRITILRIKQAAQKGQIPDEPAPWIDRLSDESVQRLTLPIGPVKKNPAPAEKPKAAAQAPVKPVQAAAAPVQTSAPKQQAPQPYQPPVRQPSAPVVPQQRPDIPAAAQPQRMRTPSRGVPELFGGDEVLSLEEDVPMKRSGRKKAKDDAPVGMVFIIFLLVLVVLGLIWMLLVMLMSKGYLPVMDFGFAQWFNSHVFHLF